MGAPSHTHAGHTGEAHNESLFLYIYEKDILDDISCALYGRPQYSSARELGTADASRIPLAIAMISGAGKWNFNYFRSKFDLGLAKLRPNSDCNSIVIERRQYPCPIVVGIQPRSNSADAPLEFRGWAIISIVVDTENFDKARSLTGVMGRISWIYLTKLILLYIKNFYSKLCFINLIKIT